MNKKKVIGVIPARFGSSRFPGKPLVELAGKTMIRRVAEAALAADCLDIVIVATDNEQIAREARSTGAIVATPEGEFLSGTDRVAAAVKLAGGDADIIINIQGDEPLLEPGLINALARESIATGADIVTPVSAITNAADLDNPTVVKTAISKNGYALYFSRSAIPHARGVEREKWIENGGYYKHIGLYAYRRDVLELFVKLPQSPLEIAEQLEQLRLLEHGAQFRCLVTDANLIAIDSLADAEAVRLVLSKNKLQ